MRHEMIKFKQVKQCKRNDFIFSVFIIMYTERC